jgi:hypothetical protein
MKTVISVASALACAFSLDAQITATLNRLPDGTDELRIRNNSATSLVVFAVAAKRARLSPTSLREALQHSAQAAEPAARNPFVVYSDPMIEPAAKPLLAGEQRVMAVTFMQKTPAGTLQPWSLEEPIVTAGISADGATTGDAGLLSRLMLRRSNMLLAVDTALETLSSAERQGVSRYQLIVQFKKITDSLHRWYLPLEQQIGLRVYEPILGKLVNMPRGPDGSPDPLANFIEEETAMLRQRRVTLSESQPSLVDAALIGR